MNEDLLKRMEEFIQTATPESILEDCKKYNLEVEDIKPVEITAYLVNFNQVNLDGILYTKESFSEDNLKALIAKGEITSYEIDDNGIKVTKKLTDKQK